MARSAGLIALLLCAALVAGLQHAPDELGFRVAGPEHAIAAGSEEQLRAALAAADLGWRDRRVVQLTAHIELSSTLVVTGPVRLQGNCAGTQGGRCTLRGSAAATGGAPQPLPLVHVTGPAAVVELANLELAGGRGSDSLAGGLTASNHSLVDLVAVRLAGNGGAAGGGARVDTHARLTLTGCEVAGNTAQQACGGVYVHSGVLHLDRSTVRDNEAAEGGGICLAAASRLSASRSQLGRNRQSSGSSSAGGDLLLADGEESAAYMEPLPAADELSVSGGEVRRLALLQAAADPKAADISPKQLHRLWEGEQLVQQQLAQQQAQQEPEQRQPTQQVQQQQQAQQALRRPNKEISEDERIVRAWMEAAMQEQQQEAAAQPLPGDADAAAASAADGSAADEAPRKSRKLKQNPSVVGVTTETELALAIQDKERFIRLDGHIGLTGAFKSPQATLPPIKASVTITGNCNDAIYGGRCLIDAKAINRIFHADNSGFMPSFFVTFENVRLTGGAAAGLGGAFYNQGKMQVEFKNCEFVSNSAQNGAGAVSLGDGAIGLFNKVVFDKNSAAYGAGGAVYLTSNAGFTDVSFQSNSAPSGGAVGVGQSSSGIYFNGCTFNGNSADVFGNDVYMESWVATPAYFNPYPTTAQVYPESTIAPYSGFRGWPAYPLFASPPPSPPRPPRPPPPAPPAPPNPASWIYSEEQLWQALAAGNSTVTLGAHIQMTPGGRWWQGPPPSIVFPMTILSQCKGFGSKCIVDLNGAPNPLFVVGTNAILSVNNVRVLNGATMGNGAAVQISGAVKSVRFDWCDFMGNIATDGGAVNILGASNIRFTNCNFGVNYADNMGGAVKTVGSNVTFSTTAFYQNRASTGGAIGMGPTSNIVLLNSNFSDNLASKKTQPDGDWGDDIFIAAPAGSSIALNKLPPESVAKIFPRRANTLLYTAPPPAPSPPPLPSSPYMRPPFPAPQRQPPARVRAPPPNPPSPPPFPPPGPPAPPVSQYVKTMPTLWGPIVMGAFLLLVMVFFISLLCCHKRVLPRLEKPGELEKRLRGDYQPSDSEEEEMSVADPQQSEIEVTMEGFYGTARFRRKGGAQTGQAAAGAEAPAAGPAQ